MQTFILSIIFSILSVFSADKDDWITTKSKESNISFKMPVKNQVLKKELNGITSEVFQTKDLTCVYGIVASKFKDTDFSTQPIDKFYKEMKEGSLTDRSAKLISEITLPYHKMLVKEIKYSIIYNKMEYIYYKRFIFRGNYSYQIVIGAYRRHIHELDANKEKFFNSVNFLE